MTHPWNKFDAELADTLENEQRRRGTLNAADATSPLGALPAWPLSAALSALNMPAKGKAPPAGGQQSRLEAGMLSAAESEPCTEPEAGVDPASGTTSGPSGLAALA